MAVTAGNQTKSVASGATSYVFPTAQPNGTGYTVSVQTQPTGQTCAVDNATGTIAAGNVTNANVTCTTNTYTVTPSVSGGNGTISPDTPQTVSYNATQIFTLTPDTGYHIVTPVGGTCGGLLSAGTYTTNAVTANCTVIASFAQTPDHLAISTVANGTAGAALGKLSLGGLDCMKSHLADEQNTSVKSVLTKALEALKAAQRPAVTPETKYYVAVGPTTDKTGRTGTEVDDLVHGAAPVMDGKGGGRPQMAQARGARRDRLPSVLEQIRQAVRETLAG
jgi:hypothetical protein